MEIKKEKKVISFDFDGVIHKYSKRYHDGTLYDPPIDGAIEGLEDLIYEGYDIVITTVRPNYKQIPAWLIKHGMNPRLVKRIETTNKKKEAIAYVDDRAIRFTNFGDIIKYFK